jgi:hypothetical protein
MTRPTYGVHLDGVDAHDMPVGILRDLCDILLEGAQRAARLALEGRSIGRGPTPARVVELGDVRVAAYRHGSLDMVVTSPTIAEAARDLIAQQNLFAEAVAPDITAMDLFLRAAEDAVAGRQDSECLDAGMLEVLARTQSLFARGATGLLLSGRGEPLMIDASKAEGIRRLREQTPESRVSRIQGLLDSVTYSTTSFVVRLDDGNSLRGLSSSIAADTLAARLGHRVVLEGVVSFKPSGKALRIEADYIADAQPGDELWAHLPRATTLPHASALPSSDLGAIYGRWPGDEDDAQIFAALDELS